MSQLFLSANTLEKQPVELQKRRRIPSKYAAGIDELKKTAIRTIRKEKVSSSNEEAEQQLRGRQSKQADDGNFQLRCILPQGRKLRLSIIIKKNPKKIAKKQSLPAPPKKMEKDEGKGSLLDAFMLAFEKLDNNVEEHPGNRSGQKLEEENSQLAENDGNKKLQPKVRKEKEDEERYYRLYEKYRLLSDKLNRQEEQIILI